MKEIRIKKKDKNKEVWLNLIQTSEYRQGTKERYKIERKFGEAKQGYGLGRCRYIGKMKFADQIAKDPVNAAPYLDVPAYRYQRILYPILANVISLGNKIFILWLLILIDIISLDLGTVATKKILNAHGYSRWYVLTYGAFAGLLLSLRLDLTEPLAFALVQWGVLFFDRRQLWRSLPFFALAALTRELTLFFAAACAMSLLANKNYRIGVLWGLGVIIPFGL